MNRILVIDDDSVTLEALPALLRSRLPDTIVDTTMSAEDALELTRTSPYQLIFLDIRMPTLDGMTLLRQLRAHAENARVIVMTAHVDESLVTEASQVGIYAFIPKPAFPDVIIAKAQAALGGIS